MTNPNSLCESWSSPILGHLTSRIVMTAMTRSFAGPGHVATESMARYYARRAREGVGLVLTESTAVDAIGDGFPDAPRMCTPEQIASWRPVTEAVHSEGGRIFCQLLHAGRITHQDFTDGQQPVSATERPASGICRRNGKPYAVPRRLTLGEIPGIYALHCDAAIGALSAGFDGVELHLAHGYLADQFLDARVNDRNDRYGGSVANRARFAIELTERVIGACGPERVMVRISPSRWMDGLYEWPDLPELLDHLLHGLQSVGLVMLDISCARAEYAETSGRVVRYVRPRWPHFLIAGASLSAADAQQELDEGLLDMVTYGRLLIANPDLVLRLREGLPLTPYDASMLASLDVP